MEAKLRGESTGNLKVTETRAFSYGTQIKGALPDGRTLGNVTKYSQTTTSHQTAVGCRLCDIVVFRVPQGTSDLEGFALQHPERCLSREEFEHHNRQERAIDYFEGAHC